MRFLGVENVTDQPVYDTIRVPVVAGVQTVSFFVIPQTGLLAAGIPKTYAMTNLLQVGRIDKGYQLTIKAISLTVLQQLMVTGTVRTWVNYQAIYNLSFLDFRFNDRNYLYVPTQMVPPGAEENALFSNIAPAATEFYPNHGLGGFTNKFKLDNPLTLEEEETIRVDLFVGSAVAVAAVDVRLTLWGDMIRPVA